MFSVNLVYHQKGLLRDNVVEGQLINFDKVMNRYWLVGKVHLAMAAQEVSGPWSIGGRSASVTTTVAEK